MHFQPVAAVAPQTIHDVLTSALQSAPFQAGTALVACLSFVLAASAFYRTVWGRPCLSLYPADSLGLVRDPSGGLSAIHLMGAIANRGASIGVVLRLEAHLSHKDGFDYRFAWNEFYSYSAGGGTLQKANDPHPLAVKAGGSIALFVQFGAPGGKVGALPPGEWLVRIDGWVNVRERASANLSCIFHVDVDPSVSTALSQSTGSHGELRVPVKEWQTTS